MSTCKIVDTIESAVSEVCAPAPPTFRLWSQIVEDESGHVTVQIHTTPVVAPPPAPKPAKPAVVRPYVIIDNWDTPLCDLRRSIARQAKAVAASKAALPIYGPKLSGPYEDDTIPENYVYAPDEPRIPPPAPTIELEEELPPSLYGGGWFAQNFNPGHQEGMAASAASRSPGQSYRDVYGYRGCAKCGHNFWSRAEHRAHFKKCYYGENDLTIHELESYIEMVRDTIMERHFRSLPIAKIRRTALLPTEGIRQSDEAPVEPPVSPPLPTIPEEDAEEASTPEVSEDFIASAVYSHTIDEAAAKTPGTIATPLSGTPPPFPPAPVMHPCLKRPSTILSLRDRAPYANGTKRDYVKELPETVARHTRQILSERRSATPNPTRLREKTERARTDVARAHTASLFYTEIFGGEDSVLPPDASVPVVEELSPAAHRDLVSAARMKPNKNRADGSSATTSSDEYLEEQKRKIVRDIVALGVEPSVYKTILYCPTLVELEIFRGTNILPEKAQRWLLEYVNMKYFRQYELKSVVDQHPTVRDSVDAFLMLFRCSDFVAESRWGLVRKLVAPKQDLGTLDLALLATQSWATTTEPDYTQEAPRSYVCTYFQPKPGDDTSPEEALAIIKASTALDPIEQSLHTMLSGITGLTMAQGSTIFASAFAAVLSIRNVFAISTGDWKDKASLVVVAVASITSLVCSSIALYIQQFGNKCILAKVRDVLAVKKAMTAAFTNFVTPKVAEEQSDVGDSPAGMIMLAIASFISLFSSDFGEFISKRAKNIRDTNVVAGSVLDMWKHCQNVFTTVEETWEEAAREAVEVLTSINATPMSQYASLPFLNHRNTQIAHVETVLKRLDGLQKQDKTSKTLQVYISRITSLLVACDKSYTDAKALEITSKVVRREPVGINIWGPAGQGKTDYVTYKLRPKLAAACGIPSSYITSTGADKYAPKVGVESFYIADEFLFSGKEDYTLQKYTALLSAGPCNMDSAFVKNQIPNFAFLITISNKDPMSIDYANAYGMSEAGAAAIKSRMNSVMFLDVNKEPGESRYANQDDSKKDVRFYLSGPDGHKEITEQQIIDTCVAQFKQFEKDYQRRLAISVAEIENQVLVAKNQSGQGFRPIVFTLFGAPGTGKSTAQKKAAADVAAVYNLPIVNVDSDWVDMEHPCVYVIEDLVLSDMQGYCNFYDRIHSLSVVFISENFRIMHERRLFSKDIYTIAVDSGRVPDGLYRRLSFCAPREGGRRGEEFMARGSFDQMGNSKHPERTISSFPHNVPRSGYDEVVSSVLVHTRYEEAILEYYRGEDDTEPEVYDLVIDISQGIPPVSELRRVASCNFNDLSCATINNRAKLSNLYQVVNPAAITPTFKSYLKGEITLRQAVLQIIDYMTTVDQSITVQFICDDGGIISYHHGKVHDAETTLPKEARAVRQEGGYLVAIDPMTFVSDEDAEKIVSGRIREVPYLRYRESEVRKRVTMAIKIAHANKDIPDDTLEQIKAAKAADTAVARKYLKSIEKIQGVWHVIKILLGIGVVVCAGVGLVKFLKRRSAEAKRKAIEPSYVADHWRDKVYAHYPGGETVTYVRAWGQAANPYEVEDTEAGISGTQKGGKGKGKGADARKRGPEKVVRRNPVMDEDDDDDDYYPGNRGRTAGAPLRAMAYDPETKTWGMRDWDLQAIEEKIKTSPSGPAREKWVAAKQYICTAAKKQMVKTVLPRPITVPQPELTHVQDLAQKQSCWVSYVNTKSSLVSSCIGHYIGGKYILTVSHLAPSTDASPVYTIKDDEGEYTAKYVAELQERDVTLLEVVDKTFKAKKTMLPFFVKNSDIEEENVRDVRLQLYTKEGTEIYHGANTEGFSTCPAWPNIDDGRISHHNPDELRVDWVGIRDAPTSDGSCGSFYMLSNKALGSRRIVAIHTTIIPNLKETVGSIVTQESIVALLRAAGTSQAAERAPEVETTISDIEQHKSATHPLTGEKFYIPLRDAKYLEEVSDGGFDLPDTDRFVQLGKCMPLWRPCNSQKDGFVRSPFHKYTTLPDECMPAIQTARALAPEVQETLVQLDGVPHILGNQVGYLAFDSKSCNQDDLDQIGDFLFDQLKVYTEGLRPLNNHEVLNGITNKKDPLYGNCGPIDIEKSAGIVGKQDNRMRKSEYLEKVEEAPGVVTIRWKKDRASQDMKQRVKVIEQMAKMGKKISCLIEDKTKVELLKTSKATSGGTRCIKNSPMDSFLFQRKWAAALQACMRRHRFAPGNFFVIGMNPYTETSRMYRELAKISTQGIALDFKRFDARCNTQIQGVVRDIQVKLFLHAMADMHCEFTEEELTNIFDTIRFHNSRDMHICDGVLYMTDGSLNSGVYSTNKDDGFNNQVAWLYVALQCWRKSDEFDPNASVKSFLWNFSRSSRNFVNGDDFIATMTERVCRWLNFNTAVVEYEAIGMIADSPAKNGEGMAEPIVHLDQMEFSSRKFVFTDGKENAAGALKTISIERAFHWVSRENKTEVVATIQSAMIEACLHGPQYYNGLRKEYIRCSNELFRRSGVNYEYTPPTYAEMRIAMQGLEFESPILNTRNPLKVSFTEDSEAVLVSIKQSVQTKMNYVEAQSVEGGDIVECVGASEACEPDAAGTSSRLTKGFRLQIREIERPGAMSVEGVFRPTRPRTTHGLAAYGICLEDDPFVGSIAKRLRISRDGGYIPMHPRRIITIEFSDTYRDCEIERASDEIRHAIMRADQHHMVGLSIKYQDQGSSESDASPAFPELKISSVNLLNDLRTANAITTFMAVKQGSCSGKPDDDLKHMVKFFQNATYAQWNAYDPRIKDYLRAAQSYFDKRPCAIPLSMRLRLKLDEKETDTFKTQKQSIKTGGNDLKAAFMAGKTATGITDGPDIPATDETIVHGDGSTMPGVAPMELGVMNPDLMEGFGSVPDEWLDMVGPRLNLEDAIFNQAYQLSTGTIKSDAAIGTTLFETAYGDDKVPPVIQKYINLHKYAKGGFEIGFSFTTGMTTNAQVMVAWLPRGNGTATDTAPGTYTPQELMRARRFKILQLSGTENFVTVRVNDILLDRFVRKTSEFGLPLSQCEDRPRFVFVLWNSIQDLVGSNTVSVSWRSFLKVSDNFRATDFDIDAFVATGSKTASVTYPLTDYDTRFLNIVGKTSCPVVAKPTAYAIQPKLTKVSKSSPFLQRTGLATGCESSYGVWTIDPSSAIEEQLGKHTDNKDIFYLHDSVWLFQGPMEGYSTEFLDSPFTDSTGQYQPEDLAFCVRQVNGPASISRRPLTFGGLIESVRILAAEFGGDKYYMDVQYNNGGDIQPPISFLGRFNIQWKGSWQTQHLTSVSTDYEVPTNLDTVCTVHRISSHVNSGPEVFAILAPGIPIGARHTTDPNNEAIHSFSAAMLKTKSFKFMGIDAPTAKWTSLNLGRLASGDKYVSMSNCPVSSCFVGQELNTTWCPDDAHTKFVTGVFNTLASQGAYVGGSTTYAIADLCNATGKMGEIGFDPYYATSAPYINTDVHRGYIPITSDCYITNVRAATSYASVPPFPSAYIQIVPERASPSENFASEDVLNKAIDKRLRVLFLEDELDSHRKQSWVGGMLGGISGAAGGAAGAWQNQYDWKQRKDMQKNEIDWWREQTGMLTENELDKIRARNNFNAINSHYRGSMWNSTGTQAGPAMFGGIGHPKVRNIPGLNIHSGSENQQMRRWASHSSLGSAGSRRTSTTSIGSTVAGPTPQMARATARKEGQPPSEMTTKATVHSPQTPQITGSSVGTGAVAATDVVNVPDTTHLLDSRA